MKFSRPKISAPKPSDVPHLHTAGIAPHVPPHPAEVAHQAVQAAHQAGGVVAQAAHHASGVTAQAAHHAGGVAAQATHHAGGVAAKGVHHAEKVVAQAAHHAGGVTAQAAHHAGGVASQATHQAGGVASQAAHNAGGIASQAAHQAGGVASQAAHHAGGVASQLVMNPGHVLSAGYHQEGKATAQAVHHAGGVAADTAHHAGGVAAQIGHHEGGLLSGGAHHAPQVASELVKHPGHILSEGWHELPHNLTTAFQQGGLDLLHMRYLRPQEKAVARQVFRDSVPLERVLISSLEGLNGRPFTIPGSMFMSVSLLVGFAAGGGVGALIAVAPDLMADIASKYIIFMGSDGYKDAMNHPNDDRASGQTLIHELTHVWQGHNNAFQWSYVFSSIWNQCQCGGNAYSFVLKEDPSRHEYNCDYNQAWKDGINPYTGKPYRPTAVPSQPGSLHSLQTTKGSNPQWSSWGVEQQASIVEAWYSGYISTQLSSPSDSPIYYNQMDPWHPAYPYIVNNIWPGNPTAENYRS